MPNRLPEINNIQIISAFNFLLANAHLSPEYFALSKKGVLSVNWIFKTNKVNELSKYIQNLIDLVNQDMMSAPNNRTFSPFTIILLQKLIHLNPNGIIQNLNLVVPKQLMRKELSYAKSELDAKENTLHGLTNLVSINFDPETGLYTAPDDLLAHQHGQEASRIFFATQWERFKGFISRLFAKIGIHVFENAPYEEHDYLHSDIYANDFAVDPYQTEQSSHFFIGHASNLINIPTATSPLHVLTDPVEGDLNPLFYPRMTRIANKIDKTNERMLPKIDVVIISHNHRDHVDLPTLKRLVSQQPLMIIPEGDMALFKDLGFKRIVDLKWWEQATIREQGKEILRITAVPTRHWSGRGLCDAHHSAFNGYVLQTPQLDGDIYFAGDTALMDEQTSAPIFQHFNIKASIQPGGPDETRKDMESTHQSSADALLMHFKILLAHYKKQCDQGSTPQLTQFLDECKTIKTIYNHTATFKLGNLRLRDTFYSVNRIIAAFSENESWQRSKLTPYEYDVFTGINALKMQMEFADNERLTEQHVIDILTHSVIIPKIGQRLTLSTQYRLDFNYRNLILNKRVLVELDTLTERLLKTNNTFSAKELLAAALEAYVQPWHAPMTRNVKTAVSYKELLKNEHLNLTDLVNKMEQELQPLNRFGHMQNIINYTKWLIEVETRDNPYQYLQDFFTCTQIQRDIDQEIHSKRTSILQSHTHKQKQNAFKHLSQQLAQAPKEKPAYAQTILRWQEHLTNTPPGNLLNQHRLFKAPKTHSQLVIEENLHRVSETNDTKLK